MGKPLNNIDAAFDVLWPDTKQTQIISLKKIWLKG